MYHGDALRSPRGELGQLGEFVGFPRIGRLRKCNNYIIILSKPRMYIGAMLLLLLPGELGELGEFVGFPRIGRFRKCNNYMSILSRVPSYIPATTREKGVSRFWCALITARGAKRRSFLSAWCRLKRRVATRRTAERLSSSLLCAVLFVPECCHAARADIMR